MPETVKLGDRYWLVRHVSELAPSESATVLDCIDTINTAHKLGDEERIYEAAKHVIDVCLVDDVDIETVYKLDRTHIGNLITAIDDHPDTDYVHEFTGTQY